jgi:hypothetical protein
MFWAPVPCLGAESKTFLAIEVQVQGDAGAWRWWCGGSDDPLVIQAWRGFWQGLDEAPDLEVVSQLKGNDVDVHPMYCKGPLDRETALNLSGLFGAENVRVGRLEISGIQGVQDPSMYSVVLRYREKMLEETEATTTGASKDVGSKAKPLWAERNITSLQAVNIPERTESGARDLAHQVRQLSAQSAAAARRLRSQIFVVKDLNHRDADTWLIHRLASVLPEGVRVEAEGSRGRDGLLRISAPRSNKGDLIELMRERLSTDDAQFLIFEGTTVEGLPIFQAVGAPFPPWAPRPEPEPEPEPEPVEQEVQ